MNMSSDNNNGSAEESTMEADGGGEEEEAPSTRVHAGGRKRGEADVTVATSATYRCNDYV